MIAAKQKSTPSLYTFVIFFTFSSFSTLLAQKNTVDPYRASIDEWHQKRTEQLKAENGWLNLAGLFWLQPGKNTFGSGNNVQLVFPAGTIQENAGYFELTDTAVWLVAAKGASITLKGNPVQRTIIYHKDSIISPVLAAGALRFTIIRREDKIGVRLRNLNSELLKHFSGIERFPVDSAWRIQATLQPSGLINTIAITNVLGQTTQQKSPGKLLFSINGVAYTFDALEEDGELFIIFGDDTNEITTYPSGRFLKVKKPDATGKTIIDFNKAYNPPCAFTTFATCPLPPRQNILPIEVNSGEKKYGKH